MSKITLTPNASGTGTFTVTSPNSNTNRTLTLPDEAGELLINGTTSNVGIGTSSPQAKLQVVDQLKVSSTDQASGAVVLGDGSSANFNVGIARWNGGANAAGAGGVGYFSQGSTNAGGHFFYTGDASAGSTTERMRIDSSGDMLVLGGTVRIKDSGNTSQRGAIYGDASSFHINAGVNNLIAYSAGTERMRIDSSGNLLVGRTSQIHGGKISLDYTNGVTAGMAIKDTQTSGTGVPMQIVNGSGTIVGSITQNQSSTSFNTSSDYRLKTDTQPMTGASARVQALNPVNFEWIASGDRVDGFLAHEAQEVVPEAVTGTKDAMRDEEYEVTPAVYEDVVIPAVLDDEGNELEAERTEQQLVTEAVMGTRSVPEYQGIDQSKLVPLLTAALQEALTEISDLKARVTALEAV